jgi:hypothetical protein
MRRTDLSLDEEIAEVEGRLSQHRAELRLLAAEARSRVSIKNAVPVTLVAALAVGFAASRFARRAPRAAAAGRSRSSRTTRIAGAIASALLPRLIRPLQAAATQWVEQRMRRSAAYSGSSR